MKLTKTKIKFIVENVLGQILLEQSGVPSNLFETSNMVIDTIVSKLKENNNNIIDSSIELILENNFKIGDFVFDLLKVKIEVRRNRGINGINLLGAELYGKTESQEKFLVKNAEFNLNNNYLNFTFETFPNYRVTNGEISNIFKNNKIDFNRIISHELKHLYDGIKKPLDKIVNKAEYSSYVSNIGKNIKPLNLFIKGLYYTHDFENLVRNSELGSLLYNYNITKENFKTFLENSEIYKELKIYKTLSIEDIITDIKVNYKYDIDGLLRNGRIEGIERMTLDEKIDKLFFILYVLINSSKIKILKDMLKDPIHGGVELFGKNKEYFEHTFNKIANTHVMEFFKQKQLEINNNADKTIKKLSKLYSLIKESRVTITKTGLTK